MALLHEYMQKLHNFDGTEIDGFTDLIDLEWEPISIIALGRTDNVFSSNYNNIFIIWRKLLPVI